MTYRMIKVSEKFNADILLEGTRFIQVPSGMTEEQEKEFIWDKVYEICLPMDERHTKIVDVWDRSIEHDWEYQDTPQNPEWCS